MRVLVCGGTAHFTLNFSILFQHGTLVDAVLYHQVPL